MELAELARILSWLLWSMGMCLLPALVVWQLVTGKALVGNPRGILPRVGYRRDSEPVRYWIHVTTQAALVLAHVVVATYVRLYHPEYLRPQWPLSGP